MYLRAQIQFQIEVQHTILIHFIKKRNMNLDNPLFEHIFVVSLQKIKIDLDNKSTECRIKYKYSLLSNEEVSTSVFVIDGNNEFQDIPQSGFNEYILSSKTTDDIREFLDNNLLEFHVFDHETKIGSGSVNLSEIYSDSSQKMTNQKSFIRNVSLLPSKYSPIKKVLGAIEGLFVLVSHECIQCKCEKIYRMSGIQKHINQSACKSQYSIEEIESLKHHAKAIRKKKQKFREFRSYDPVKRTEKHKKTYNAKKHKQCYDISKLETNPEAEADSKEEAILKEEEARKETIALNSAIEKESKVRKINKYLLDQTISYFENGCKKLKNRDLSKEVLEQLKKLENVIFDLHKKFELEIDALNEKARKKASNTKMIKDVNDVYIELCHGFSGVNNLGRLCLEWHELQLDNDHALKSIAIIVNTRYVCSEEHFCIHCETSHSKYCSNGCKIYNPSLSHISQNFRFLSKS